jgi:hypothetical protein
MRSGVKGNDQSEHFDREQYHQTLLVQNPFAEGSIVVKNQSFWRLVFILRRQMSSARSEHPLS